MSNAMTRVSEEAQTLSERLSQDIDGIVGEPAAFSLHIWTNGRFVWTKGRCAYVTSAADRSEIINALEQMIAGWKAGMPDIPAHDVN